MGETRNKIEMWGVRVVGNRLVSSECSWDHMESRRTHPSLALCLGSNQGAHWGGKYSAQACLHSCLPESGLAPPWTTPTGLPQSKQIHTAMLCHEVWS